MEIDKYIQACHGFRDRLQPGPDNPEELRAGLIAIWELAAKRGVILAVVEGQLGGIVTDPRARLTVTDIAEEMMMLQVHDGPLSAARREAYNQLAISYGWEDNPTLREINRRLTGEPLIKETSRPSRKNIPPNRNYPQSYWERRGIVSERDAMDLLASMGFVPD